MSWDHTYSHTVALAVDRFGAAIIYNEPDITISSLCWIVRTNAPTLASLKLSPWQLKSLVYIGNGLERFFPGHCAAARLGDLETSARSRTLLVAPAT
jgi:hypothetical protein